MKIAPFGVIATAIAFCTKLPLSLGATSNNHTALPLPDIYTFSAFANEDCNIFTEQLKEFAKKMHSQFEKLHTKSQTAELSVEDCQQGLAILKACKKLNTNYGNIVQINITPKYGKQIAKICEKVPANNVLRLFPFLSEEIKKVDLAFRTCLNLLTDLGSQMQQTVKVIEERVKQQAATAYDCILASNILSTFNYSSSEQLKQLFEDACSQSFKHEEL